MTDKAIAIIPRTLDEVHNLSGMFSKSSLIPEALRGKEADVFVSIMAGAELGLPPMAALRGVHVVKGKPVLSADTMVAIVLGSGIAVYFQRIDETPTSVTYETLRKGAPGPVKCTWSDADSKTAGLTSGTHLQYPRAMRQARCKAMLARDAYPDVLAGCYDEHEARESFDAPAPIVRHVDAVDAEVIPIVGDPLIDIDACETIDELKALAPTIANLPEDVKASARVKYIARRTQIEQSLLGQAVPA